MKISKKIQISMISMFLLVFALGAFTPILAQNVDVWGSGTAGDYMTNTGMGQSDPRAIAASVIKIMLGFLGIIAVVIMLFGGFKWMTAGGNEDGVAEAKKLIGAGVVGLIIILASYGLANFVLTAIINATGA